VDVVPLTVQTLVVVEAKLSRRFWLAGVFVDPTSVRGVPTVCAPGLAKVMVCGVKALLKSAVCEEPAAKVPLYPKVIEEVPLTTGWLSVSVAVVVSIPSDCGVK
jgi:hypothetical protein